MSLRVHLLYVSSRVYRTFRSEARENNGRPQTTYIPVACCWACAMIVQRVASTTASEVRCRFVYSSPVLARTAGAGAAVVAAFEESEWMDALFIMMCLLARAIFSLFQLRIVGGGIILSQKGTLYFLLVVFTWYLYLSRAHFKHQSVVGGLLVFDVCLFVCLSVSEDTQCSASSACMFTLRTASGNSLTNPLGTPRKTTLIWGVDLFW